MSKCKGDKPTSADQCPRPPSRMNNYMQSENSLQPSAVVGGPEVKTNRHKFDNDDAEKAFEHMKNQVGEMANSDVTFICRHDLIQRMDALFQARQDTTRFAKKELNSLFDRMNPHVRTKRPLWAHETPGLKLWALQKSKPQLVPLST